MKHFDLESQEFFDLSSSKEGGTADSNPRFARNGDFIVIDNGQSDGLGEIFTFSSDIQEFNQDQEVQRDTLFRNSEMIDWE